MIILSTPHNLHWLSQRIIRSFVGCRGYYIVLPIVVLTSGCGGSGSSSKSDSSSTAACNMDSRNESQCKVAAAGYAVTDKVGSDIIFYVNSSASTTVSAAISTGWYQGKSCQFTDSNLVAANIKNGSSIFGVVGVSSGLFSMNTNSNALRDPGSVPAANHLDIQSTSQSMSLYSEVNNYSGSSLPTSNAYNYRDVPVQNKDDDGYLGTSCKYASRPTVNCGTSQSSLALRLADCTNLNGTCSNGSSTTQTSCESAQATWSTTATWDGSIQCNGGQGVWKLVTRSAANKEVWQDQRTGLLWSSLVSTSANWCQASGNTQKAPFAYYQSYNTSMGTKITGNGKIMYIAGGLNTTEEIVTITFTSSTQFTVAGSVYASWASGPSCDDSQSPALTGSLTATAGSSATYAVSNVCSFTMVQGSIPFATGDTLILSSSDMGIVDCTAGGNATMTSYSGSSLQPSSPLSLCAEASGLNASGETWNQGGYMSAKGGLGKNSTPSVAWRLPTLNDYNIADINGIRFVIPDMGIAGSQRPQRDASSGGANLYEWVSTVNSTGRGSSWAVSSSFGNKTAYMHNTDQRVRCVGR